MNLKGAITIVTGGSRGIGKAITTALLQNSAKVRGMIFLKLINNFTKKIQKKSIFNQYLEIGGRLQPNFANFNLDFLPKYR